MDYQSSPSVDNSQIEEIKRRLETDRQYRGGISWFFWIAALSVINTVMYLMGSDTSFLMGLGVTQFIDVIAIQLRADLGSGSEIITVVAIVLDLLLAGIFVIFGILGRKKMLWAVVVGMVLYLLDGIFIFVLQVYSSGSFTFWPWWGSQLRWRRTKSRRRS
jgi:hypothetical protein